MRRATLRLTLLGGLLLVGVATALVAATFPTAVPATTDLPPELGMVPQDSLNFVHLQVDKLLAHPVALNLLKRLPPEMLRELTTELKLQDWGFGLHDVLSGTGFLYFTSPTPEDMGAGVIVVTRKPYDRPKLIKGLLREAEEKKAGDKVYYVAKESVGFLRCKLHFIDDRRFLVILGLGIGDDNPKFAETLVQKIYKPQEKGPLAEIIAAARDHLLIHGMCIPETLRPLVTQPGIYTGELSWLEVLNHYQTAQWTLSLDQVSTVRMQYRFAEATKAQDALEAAKHGLKFLREQLETMLVEIKDKAAKTPDPQDPCHPTLALLREVEAALKTAMVRVQDKELQLTFTFKTDDAVMDQVAKLLTALWKQEMKR